MRGRWQKGARAEEKSAHAVAMHEAKALRHWGRLDIPMTSFCVSMPAVVVDALRKQAKETSLPVGRVICDRMGARW